MGRRIVLMTIILYYNPSSLVRVNEDYEQTGLTATLLRVSLKIIVSKFILHFRHLSIYVGTITNFKHEFLVIFSRQKAHEFQCLKFKTNQ